ncbi:MAG: YncE family protein [Nitrososphaera sp.]
MIAGVLLLVPLLGEQRSFSQQGNEILAEMPIERFIPYGHTLNVPDLGIDTAAQVLFFTDSNNRALVFYDLQRNVTKNVEIGPSPHTIAVNSATGKAYVTSSCNCPAGLAVTVIDYSKGVESAKVQDTIASASRPAAPIALNPDTGRVYVGSDSNSIVVIDGSNNKVVGRIEGVNNVQGIDVNPKTNEVYAIDDGATLYKIGGTTNKVVGNITIGLPEGVQANGSIIKAIAVNPNTNVVYVINAIKPGPSLPNEGISIPTGYLAAINGTSNTIISSNITRLNSFNFDLGVNPSTNTIYVLGNGEIIKVNDMTNDVVRRDYFPDLKEGIRHFVIDESMNKLYLQGQTGVFQVLDNRVEAPEFHDFVMLVPALAIAAAVTLARLSRKKVY